MSEQLSAILRRKLDDLAPYGGVDAEARRNALKEELQFHVLNFIYHHSKYSNWIMYGGSALRIVHGLDRMSVDLDFEVPHAVTDEYLERMKREIGEHFLNTYGAGSDFLTIKITTGRGLVLKFRVGEALSFGHASKQVHVKVDLNHFVASKTVTERRPINRDQLSFVVVTYNMSALMASKIAAIFLRGTRGVGRATYEEKGRDIYDLLWYMGRKAIPDFDYLIAKGINVKNPRALFDKLTLQINRVSNENLKQDLTPLFMDQTFIAHWIENWRESYFRLIESYRIQTVTGLQWVYLTKDTRSDVLSFIYIYATETGSEARVEYKLSDYWIGFSEGDITTPIDEEVVKRMTVEARENTGKKTMKQKQYATLFYQKTEKYFAKTNRIMLGDETVTKVIRMTADKLNQKEQIVLNVSILLSCELDDLLK